MAWYDDGDADGLTKGTVANARLTADVTLEGNTFNGANQLVQLDAGGALPAIDGSALTNVDVTFDNVENGTNTTAAMLVGTGASLGATGTGTIDPVMSAAHGLLWTGRSQIKSSADGLLTLINAAGTDFSRLLFGGTTNAFPAWKRSATELHARLADDSAYAPLRSSVLFTDAGTAANPNVEDPVSTFGLVLNGSQGVGYSFSNAFISILDTVGSSIGSGMQYRWESTAAPAGAAGVLALSKIATTHELLVQDGSGNPAPAIMTRKVNAKTGAYPVLAADTNKVFTDEGAGAGFAFTLPTAVAGYVYTFIRTTANVITITAAAADTIQVSTSVTAGAGSITLDTDGASVTLQAINATEWIAVAVVGTVTV